MWAGALTDKENHMQKYIPLEFGSSPGQEGV